MDMLRVEGTCPNMTTKDHFPPLCSAVCVFGLLRKMICQHSHIISAFYYLSLHMLCCVFLSYLFNCVCYYQPFALSSAVLRDWTHLKHHVSGEGAVCVLSNEGKHWLRTETRVSPFCYCRSLQISLIKNSTHTQTKEVTHAQYCFCLVFFSFSFLKKSWSVN